MSYLEELIAHLYKFLIGSEAPDCNIIRKHTRQLEKFGDLSFPLTISNWHSFTDHVNINTSALINTSSSWPLRISKCSPTEDNVHIHLERASAFKLVIKQVHSERENYGSHDLAISDVAVKCDVNRENSTNLSELRLLLLRDVITNLLNFCKDKSRTEIIITLKNCKGERMIQCGPVLNVNKLKDVKTTAEELYKNRAAHMRMVAEHKYGFRVRKGHEAFIDKLGEAAVTIELLQNKPSHSITVNMDNPTLTSSRGASFILYNCARLAAVQKEFEKRVVANDYPPLPDRDLVDFALLTQPEEWELLYVYILSFPIVVKNCIKDVKRCRVNPHYLTTMLSGMCLTFSVYYRRVRFLIEPRAAHLFPVLYARMYLLKALERVLHNGLRLLNIQPVKQM